MEQKRCHCRSRNIIWKIPTTFEIQNGIFIGTLKKGQTNSKMQDRIRDVSRRSISFGQLSKSQFLLVRKLWNEVLVSVIKWEVYGTGKTCLHFSFATGREICKLGIDFTSFQTRERNTLFPQIDQEKRNILLRPFPEIILSARSNENIFNSTTRWLTLYAANVVRKQYCISRF